MECGYVEWFTYSSWSGVVLMQFSVMASHVGRNVGLTSTEVTDLVRGADGYINVAYRDLADGIGAKWTPFSGVALTAGVSAVLVSAIGSTVRRLRALAVNTGSRRLPLEWVDVEDFDQWRQSGSANGVPLVVTQKGFDQIALYPAPGTGMTLEGDYYARPTALSADTDIPTAVPEEYHWSIIYRACELALLMDGNRADEAAQYRQMYERDKESLRRAVNRMGRPAPLTPSRDLMGVRSGYDREMGFFT